MKILLLGSTGRTGKEILNQALDRQLNVRSLVRERAHLPEHEIVIGHPEELKKALMGIEVVITTLNISRKNDSPWSPLRSPKDLLSTTMKTLCKHKNLKQINCYTAWGVNESLQEIPFWFKYLIQYSIIADAYQDHGLQETILKESKIPFTMVRPVALTNGRLNPEYVLNSKNPGFFISRKSVAYFMLERVGRVERLNKTFTLSHWKNSLPQTLLFPKVKLIHEDLLNALPLPHRGQ